MKIHSWDFWDWKPFLQVSFIVIGLFAFILLLVYGPGLLMHEKEKKLDMETMATVTRIKRNIGLSQDQLGNHIQIHNMTVEYKYTIDNTTYQGLEIVPYMAPYVKFLDSIYHSQLTTIPVKYLSKNPAKSMINFK
jgi:hypothetical protein